MTVNMRKCPQEHFKAFICLAGKSSQRRSQPQAQTSELAEPEFDEDWQPADPSPRGVNSAFEAQSWSDVVGLAESGSDFATDSNFGSGRQVPMGLIRAVMASPGLSLCKF